METIKKTLKWYLQTSTLVGAPLLFLLVMMGLQKFAFTATCEIGGYRCEYAIGASEGMAQYMGELLSANPDVDIVAKPKKSR